MAARSVLRVVDDGFAPARLARGRALAIRPVSQVAFRVQESTGAKVVPFPSANPQLYVHEGARQALERKLATAYPGPVVLSVTDNRHSIVTHRCKDGVLRVRLHHMFLDAPPIVTDALVRYIVAGDRAAIALVGQYIDVNGARVCKRPRSLKLVTKGKRHDLLRLFDDLNARYFGGTINALVTWGTRSTRRRTGPRQTIKVGSYSAAERLIRVHPALDRKWVPRYFVASIVYHEMLHHALPHTRGAGRRMLHPPEFRERERAFRYAERAATWEKEHIKRLLRS